MFYDPFAFPAFGKCWSSSKEYSKFKPMLAIEKTTTCNKEKISFKDMQRFQGENSPRDEGRKFLIILLLIN